ncbi:hypothetical protein Nepgr_013711 [Nepenthes gracilis]|uniref:Translocation and assembly module TamB C-terminal domain-containing protein n=1 Tax=Nepenthes gracilis TaxID=150966 RepID=A0AAD3SHZ3_NEPGR|nr:hypothetical protein Nepgr_013711 [Nepenthes gracilis]
MSAILHCTFFGTPLHSCRDGRKTSSFLGLPKRKSADRTYRKCKCWKRNNWLSEVVWFPWFYGKYVKLLEGGSRSKNGLKIDFVKDHFSVLGNDLVNSVSPLWKEGLLLLRCSVFAAVISGVCLLVWYGQAKMKEFIELKLLPSVCSVLSEYIQREIDFGKVRRISPLSITLESCSVGPHSEEFSCGEAPSIKLRVHPFASLRTGKVVIDAVLSHPTLFVAQKKDFTWLGIPFSEGSVQRHLSTEGGIDYRTRTRRAAREEAADRWARERDHAAKQAAEMGYSLAEHSSSLLGGDANGDTNDSGVFATGKSFSCTDEGINWRDHHSLDNGIEYDAKHAELEKSFGVNVPRSKLKSLSQLTFGQMRPEFKKAAGGKYMSQNGIAAKRKILERSAKAAVQYFQGLRHEKFSASLQPEEGYIINNVDNLVIQGEADTNSYISVLSREHSADAVSKKNEVLDFGEETIAEHRRSETSVDQTGPSGLRNSVDGTSYLPFRVDQQTDDKTSDQLFLTTAGGARGYEKANDKLQVASSVDGMKAEDKNHTSDKGLEGVEFVDARCGPCRSNDQDFEPVDHVSEGQYRETCSDSAFGIQEPLSSEHYSLPVWPLSLKLTPSLFPGNIVEQLSYLLSDSFQKLKSGMGQKFEDIVAELVEEVDGVHTERIDKTLPVTLDSVYFKGGSLMLLAYGDMEPREMENVDGHIKFQNHYGRVNVQLSGNCKMWKLDTALDDGGWLSSDVFVDIVEQQWHANLKVANLFVPLFERILEIPIFWSKGRASGEVHICMPKGESFPNFHGQLDVTGLDFQILDAPSWFTDISTILSFRGQRIFLHNASGWFGNVPLEASGDLGIHPEEGEFHVMCQVPSVEVNALMKAFKMKPLLLPLAGFVTTIFNCQGPLDAPIFVGSGMITRKIGHPVSDIYASSAYEVVMKDKDAGAVAAFDRIPISYLSANFTFNTDDCIAELYGIRAALVDGGEIRGAGNAWICPEAEENETALDVNFSGNLCFDKIVHRYLPSYLHLLPLKLGELKGETKVSGSLLKPRFDVKWNAPKADGSFTDARGDVIISHDYIAVNSSSTAFDLYAKVLTSYPEQNWLKNEEYVATSTKSFVVEGLQLDLRLRGFEFFNMMSSYPFDSPRPIYLKATGKVKFQGQVIKPSNTTDQQAIGSLKSMPSDTVRSNGSMRSLVGDISISGLKLNQLMLAPQLAGLLSISRECVKLDATGRPDESLSAEVRGILQSATIENLQEGKLLSFSLQKGQLRANINYQPLHSANVEIRHLPLDELELASLRGTLQRAEVQLNLQKRRGFGILSVLRPKFSGLLGEALDVAVRWSGDVITVEKTVLEQSYSRYELQGEYVLPGTRDRKSSPKEGGRLFSREMAGHLSSMISSMGRWRMRLEVPQAEAAEMLPLARLLSRSTDPAVQSRSKDLFMQSLQSVCFCTGNLQELLEVIREHNASPDEVISEDLCLPGLAELKGRWHGSLDASGGGNGDTVAEFDFHGEDWEWGTYKTQRVLSVGTYSNDDGFRLEKIFIQKDNATIHADGTLLGPKTNLHFAVLNFPVSLVPMLVQIIESSTNDAIHSLRQLLAPIKGTLHMEGDLRGNLSKPECDVQVRLLDGAIEGVDLGRAEVVASLTSTSRFIFNAKFEPIIQNGHVHIQGSVPVMLVQNNVLKEEDTELEKDRSIWDPSWPKDGDKESGDGDTDKRIFRDRNEEGWDIQLAEGLKGLNWNILNAGEVRVDADIKDGGMMLVTALCPYADWLHGNADIMLQVRGTVERPELDGSATFHRASVSSPVLRKPLTNFGGKVLVNSNRLCISSLESRISRRGKLVVKGNLPLTTREAFLGDKIDLKCEALEVRAKNVLSGQVDTQLQITGSIMQPNISGKIKLSHGEAYLPHDKGSGSAPFNKFASSQSRLPSGGYNRMVAAYVLRFFSSEPAASRSNFSQPSGKKSDARKEMESANKKPKIDIRLSDLKLVLGPELKVVYPLILNFAVSGELELNGPAHPKLIKPKGVLTFENGDVNLVATQVRLKREYLNVAKFETDNGLDPTLDLALVGSEWQFRIQGRASNWQEKLVVTSTRSVEQDVLSPTEAARVFESQLAESILEGDGQLALKKLATATLETLMPRIEGKGEFGQARWRLVYAPPIPSLLSVDPTVQPLKSLASNISMGTEVEVQLGKRLQASILRQMKDSEMAMQWTLIYQLTSRLRVLLQSAPSKRLLFEYSTTSQD